MGVIAVVCTVFGITVSEAKTEIMFTREGDAGVHRHIQRKGSGPSVQPGEQVCILRGKRQPQCRPVHLGRPARIQRMGQLPEVHPRTVRPTKRSPRAQNPDATSRGTRTMLYGCVTWSPRACHYGTLHRTHHRFLTRCIGWRKHNRADHPISYLNKLMKTGSESIEATLRRRRILFAEFVARMEDTRLPKCVMFGEMVGSADYVGVRKKSGQVVSWTTSELSASTPTSGRLQPRTRGMAQNGRTRGGTFHDGMDRCRESQGWTTACSGMPERDGKDQGEDSPRQAGSCWFARPC